MYEKLCVFFLFFLDNGRRGHDYDEIEEEQMEKARRNKLNKDFEAFYKEVES